MASYEVEYDQGYLAHENVCLSSLTSYPTQDTSSPVSDSFIILVQAERPSPRRSCRIIIGLLSKAGHPRAVSRLASFVVPASVMNGDPI